MSNYEAVVNGRLARRPVEITYLDGSPLRCAVRPFTGEDDEAVLAGAAARAKSMGAEPVEGNHLYDFAFMCEIVARGCVDADSPPENPKQLFADASDVRRKLDRERIAALAEAQQSLQDEVGPRKKSMDVDEFIASVYDHATKGEEERLPFEFWAPVMRRSFVRSLARLYVVSQTPKSLSGAPSESSTTTSSPHRPPSADEPS